jgi:hypothetical protein
MLVRLRGVKAERACDADDGRDGACADAERSRDLSMTPSQGKLLPKDLSCLMHGKSLCRHAAVYAAGARDPKDALWLSDRDAPFCAIGMGRNR